MTFRMAVVGKNIAYSKSPFIHNAFAKALKLSVEYSLCDVGGGHFVDAIRTLQREHFTGCNITVPYKEEAIAIATRRSSRAAQAAAANTFVFEEDGSIFADNTDGIGFIRDITQNIDYDLCGKHILICGAGGAVRGILGPLLDIKPASITIANRTPKKDLQVCPYAELANRVFDVVIDGTSLRTEIPPIPDSVCLAKDALVYDLKYNSEAATAIMQWAKAKGAAYIHDGIGMLVEQAAEAFHLWTGQMPETGPVIAQLRCGEPK